MLTRPALTWRATVFFAADLWVVMQRFFRALRDNPNNGDKNLIYKSEKSRSTKCKLLKVCILGRKLLATIVNFVWTKGGGGVSSSSGDCPDEGSHSALKKTAVCDLVLLKVIQQRIKYKRPRPERSMNLLPFFSFHSTAKIDLFLPNYIAYTIPLENGFIFVPLHRLVPYMN